MTSVSWQPLAARYPQVRVVRHDIVAEELPAPRRRPFDVAHARLVLGHLPQRDDVLAKMVAGLVPGGRVLIEDLDWGSYGPALPNPAAEATIAAVTRFLRGAGFDPYFGRRLPTLMRGLGLSEVDAEGLVLTLRGASLSLEPMYRQTFERVAPRLLAAGLLTAEDADAVHARFDDPAYDMVTQTMMAVWGRRPCRPVRLPSFLGNLTGR